MSQLRCCFLGSPQIEVNGQALSLSRRKSMALLVYLAVTAVPHTREFLATLLWPNFDQTRALAYLRRALWDINQTLGEGWLQTDREQVSLPRSASVWLDVAQFQKLGHEAEKCALEEAVALYQGDFLTGFTLRDALEFDDWQYAQRELLRRQFGDCLQALIALLVEDGEMETAVIPAQRWLALDNLNEVAHRQLMSLYASMGQRSTAIQQYETCIQTLSDELDVKPEPATEALIQAIKKGEMLTVTPMVQKKQNVPSSNVRKQAVFNLPVQLTPFIGRVSEMAVIDRVMADPLTRLVTLIGPGGIGKTRLAIEFANAHKAHFKDGVCFVALSNLVNAQSIPFAVAEALGQHVPAGEDPTTILLDWLSTREILLILDNFEHVLPGAAFVQTLLINVPHLKLMITSRERLALQPERLIDVAALSFPVEAQRGISIEQFDAAVLFASRASYLRLDFDLQDEETQADVVRICQLVEGHPLALEMAASWIRSRPLADVAAALAENLGALQSSMVDMVPRHHSLQAVFDFSWQLLLPYEQDVLMKLSVFRGGFDTIAAEYVTDCTHSTLASLMEKSFVSMAENGRYALHNVYQEFALEKLQQDSKLTRTAHARHWSYFANFLAAQEAFFKGAYLKDAFAQIHQEFPNIRQAWEWALVHKQFVGMEKALTSLWFYHAEYHSEEGRQLLQHTAEVLRAEQSDDVKLLYWKVMVVEIYLISVFNRKQIVTEIAPPILNYVRDHPVADWDMLISIVVGYAKIHGIIKREEAEELESSFLAKARADEDHYWTSRLLQGLAWSELFIYEPGDMEKAEAYTLESLEIAQQHDIAVMQNASLWQMARIHLAQKEYAKAYEYGRFAWASCNQSGELGFAIVCFADCMHICLLQGEIEEAKRCLNEVLSNPRGQQGMWSQIILAYYVQVVYQEGKQIEAVEYAAMYLKNTPPEAVDRDIKEILRELENTLPSNEFQAAWARGQQMRMEDFREVLVLEKER